METGVFEASVSRIGGVPVMEMRGEINSFAQQALDRAYHEARASGDAIILLDFQNVDYINSTGIALIVSLLARAQKSDHSLVACGLSQHYQEIFEITRLTQYIRIFPDVQTALGQLNPKK
jgi:anti-sigma B factor antagonist